MGRNKSKNKGGAPNKKKNQAQVRQQKAEERKQREEKEKLEKEQEQEQKRNARKARKAEKRQQRDDKYDKKMQPEQENQNRQKREDRKARKAEKKRQRDEKHDKKLQQAGQEEQDHNAAGGENGHERKKKKKEKNRKNKNESAQDPEHLPDYYGDSTPPGYDDRHDVERGEVDYDEKHHRNASRLARYYIFSILFVLLGIGAFVLIILMMTGQDLTPTLDAFGLAG